jgi:hypothetical protein
MAGRPPEGADHQPADAAEAIDAHVHAQGHRPGRCINALCAGCINPAVVSYRPRLNPMRRAVLLFSAGVVLLVPGSAIGQSSSQTRCCAEAGESLRRGNRGIDGDGDGIPLPEGGV